MNDNLKKLIEALRSGKYKQHIGFLRSPDGEAFCFLGVAYDVSGLANWLLNDWPRPMYWYTLRGGTHTLSKHLGIPEEAIITLVGMNDDGRSFEDLAKTLEVTFGGL